MLEYDLCMYVHTYIRRYVGLSQQYYRPVTRIEKEESFNLISEGVI